MILVILEAVLLAQDTIHTSTIAIAVAYTLWVCVMGCMVWRRKMLHPKPCLLIVDLLALTLLLISAGRFTETDIATSLLSDAYFLIPVLAVLQVKPWITACISVTTAVAYGCAAALTDAPLDWPNALAGMLILLILGVGCVLLSWLQRSRTRTIANLAKDRARLLSDALTIEDRERQWLADTLHDGALQSVLAARQDFSEVRAVCSGQDLQSACARIESTLLDVVHQLRATAAGLHPTVLEDLGLTEALRAVGESMAQRANLGIRYSFDCAPNTLTAEHQKLLFGAAREFLVNAAKHAKASKVVVTLFCDEQMVRLTVVDDGAGVLPEGLRHGLAEGHLGLAAQRVRIESVDGCLKVASPDTGEGGTIASVTLPRTLPNASPM
ncbi:ATP-binding protein [Streptomyces sp. NPDC008121]|uniref:sensor histidine kinase n=1 Tax=Streptomyces sp. NPDC008121 TaxID=3364809 RepID=UPI0036E33F95